MIKRTITEVLERYENGVVVEKTTTTTIEEDDTSTTYIPFYQPSPSEASRGILDSPKITCCG